MTRGSDPAALRREALLARAELQRLELRMAIDRLHAGAASTSAASATALALARLFAARGTATSVAGARPWLLSAGWLLLRALRQYPSVRWLVGAGAAGAAVWWVVRALRTPDASDDDSG